MQLARLAATSADIAGTRSRLAKRRFIATTIAAADPAEIELVVTYLSGSLRQRRTGVGWASLSSVPEPAAEPTLTVRDVDAAFDEIAVLAGAGSTAIRAKAVEALFARATEAEQRFLRGLVFDEVRQGALDALVQDGLAEAFGVPVAAVQRAAMLLGSTPAAARLLATGGVDALAAVGLQVGLPVRPMLAASAPDVAAALEKTGLPAAVDVKLDGIRVQVHRDGPQVRVFTRSLDDITARVPEIVAAVVRAAGADDRAGRRGAVARSRAGVRWRSSSSPPAPPATSTPRPGRARCRCRCSVSTCCTSTAGICWTSRSANGSR